MKPRLLIMLLLALPLLLQGQDDSLRFTRAYVLSHQVGQLSWTRLPSATAYRLYRHYPDQGGYAQVALTADTQYTDTLRRTVCADTVGYFVEAVTGGPPLRSDTVGLYFLDNLPTTGCRLRLATVEEGRVVLSWYPSPDPDIMGYYICSGVPCLDYDTVWGRFNTVYRCPADLDCRTEQTFRILAFDSCFQASPLTPDVHNPVLALSAAPCSRQLHASWNRYIHMPDSVGRYCLYYRLQGSDSLYRHCVSADGPFSFDLTVDDLAIGSVEAWLQVYSRSDSLTAVSDTMRLLFDRGDTAAYLLLSAPVYDETLPSVTLTVQVDTDFLGDICYLMRRDDDDTAFHQITSFTRGSRWQPRFTYADTDIRRTAIRYVYRLEAPDVCRQRVTRSDTVQLLMPEVSEPAAFFSNILLPNDPEHNTFCPHYLSPLAADYSLDIYNRGGLRVFHTEVLGECWDGTASGRSLPQGVYIFRARCRHADGSDKIYTGTILLIR